MDDERIRADAPPWLKVALAEEAAGVVATGANPRILEYLKTCEDLTPEEAATDATPWCAAFASWCMAAAGMAHPHSSWARDWFDWGEPDPAPGLGSIVVWQRIVDGDFGGRFGHVAFLIEAIGDDLLVLGGNQAKQVCRARYPREGQLREDFYTAVAFRKPSSPR